MNIKELEAMTELALRIRTSINLDQDAGEDNFLKGMAEGWYSAYIMLHQTLVNLEIKEGCPNG